MELGIEEALKKEEDGKVNLGKELGEESLTKEDDGKSNDRMVKELESPTKVVV